MGDTEIEVLHMANAHRNFYLESENFCQLYLKDQGDPSGKRSLDSLTVPKATQPPSYMAKVKASFSRAWQRWDETEELQLRENFDARKDLQELAVLHQRAEGGIVARLKKLELLEADIGVEQASILLANRHEKLIRRKTYTGNLKVADTSSTHLRIDRGKDSLAEFGMVNPPPVPLPDLRHTSIFTCSICTRPVIGNSCLCRGD